MPTRYYESAIRTTGPVAGSPYANLYTSASQAAYVTEIGIFNATATAACVALVRSATVGVATTCQLGMSNDPYNPSPSSFSRLGSAWSTIPASTGNALRRVTFQNVAGAGVIWSWPVGAEFVVAACGGMTIQNPGATGGSPLDIYVKWYE